MVKSASLALCNDSHFDPSIDIHSVVVNRDVELLPAHRVAGVMTANLTANWFVPKASLFDLEILFVVALLQVQLFELSCSYFDFALVNLERSWQRNGRSSELLQPLVLSDNAVLSLLSLDFFALNFL